MNISDNHPVSCMSATLLQIAVQANHQSDLSEIKCQPSQPNEFSEISQGIPYYIQRSPCILTGLTPVVIKAEEAAKLYNIMRKRQAYEIYH